jgi:hypothetical protein
MLFIHSLIFACFLRDAYYTVWFPGKLGAGVPKAIFFPLFCIEFVWGGVSQTAFGMANQAG